MPNESGTDQCTVTGQMSPLTASVDHLAASPGNVQTFQAERVLTSQCSQAMVIPSVTWTSSDPTNAPITSNVVTGQNTAIAVVTCNQPTTATFDSNGPSATATITCR
jgi:hypothetical protein